MAWRRLACLCWSVQAWETSEHIRPFPILTCCTLQGRNQHWPSHCFPEKRRDLGSIQKLGYQLVFTARFSPQLRVWICWDYADKAGVSVAFLHKAKGYASVFFRMGTGHADIFRILPHRLYRFSHSVPFFKLTGIEGVPKDAYELDKAALPETIEDTIVPHIY